MSFLEVKDLKQHFPVRSGILMRQSGAIRAVDGIDFSIRAGETLGLVGESGCGKSTVARTIMKLYEPTAGSIQFEGRDITKFSGKNLLGFKRHVQMIFQDPYSSLNPRKTVGSILSLPLKIHGTVPASRHEAVVKDLLEKVGLGAWAINRYPHEFSGGQRQRIAIARAIILRPKLVVADEPVSALDVSVQSQILNLMKDLQTDLGLGYLFISHDLAVVKHVSHRIAVMYLGKIVEIADKDTIFAAPRHPYTQALLSSIPTVGKPRKKHNQIKGDLPTPLNPPSGCRFHTRCIYAQDVCRNKEPLLREGAASTVGQKVACHFAEKLPEPKADDVLN
jgi:oligopeptide/dipeptide ABC transporter ATP-binding protein